MSIALLCPLQEVGQGLDYWSVRIGVIHDSIVLNELFVAGCEGIRDVLYVIDQGLLEEFTIAMEFKECEYVCLTDTTITVHIQHAISKLFQVSDVFLSKHITRTDQYFFNRLIEDVVLEMRL